MALDTHNDDDDDEVMHTMHSVIYIYIALLKNFLSLSLSPSRNLQLRWVQRRGRIAAPSRDKAIRGKVPVPLRCTFRRQEFSIGSPCASALHLQKARMSMRCPATVHLANLNFISHKQTRAFNMGSADLPVSVAKQVLTGPGIP